MQGKPMYDPGQITVPVLVVVGEWDHDTPPNLALTVFSLLTNSPRKRFIMLPEGTHHLMLEKNRQMLFRVVQQFLEDDE
jgi:pimeloyl-ACP methyl ester carboxylesterase